MSDVYCCYLLLLFWLVGMSDCCRLPVRNNMLSCDSCAKVGVRIIILPTKMEGNKSEA